MTARRCLVIATVLAAMVGTGCSRSPLSAGKSLFKKGQYDAASKELEKVVTAGPESDDACTAHMYLARICGLKDDYKKGVEHCESAIKISPKHAGAYYWAIILYQLNGDMGTATRYWNKVSNMAQIGAGFALAGVNPPASPTLDEKRIAAYKALLKGE